MQIQFPSSFLWGASLSSYQCEGGNFNSDWYLWEKEKKLEPAGCACNHYYLYKRDSQLARSMHLNSLRFSLEWGRIYPEKSFLQEEELAHYYEVVSTLLSCNLKPLITLHHFTNPIWFVNRGGWLVSKNIDFFLAYLRKVVNALKEKVEYWLIFNEPLVYIYNSFIQGIWPPGIKSIRQARKVLGNILTAYSLGYQEIKRIYKDLPNPAQVSLAKHLRIFSPCPEFSLGLNSFSSFLREKIFNFSLLEYLRKRNCLDFLAINYYCKEYVKFNGIFGEECAHKFHWPRRNYLGWYIYPEGLYEILCKSKKFNLPIIITENGTAEDEDSLYGDYLLAHLRSLGKAVLSGIDVRGYLWWSLLDNFEWDKGFKCRFGLAEVDYNNFQRKVRPFAFTYSRICRENKLEI